MSGHSLLASMSSTSEKKKKTSDDFVELDETQVLGLFPNKTARKLLAEQWYAMTPQQQMHIKAARSKRGIHCDVCGMYGYYRENCPNGCLTPPGTPDSLDSTPPTTPRKRPIPKPKTSEALVIHDDHSISTLSTHEPAGFFWGTEKNEDQILRFTKSSGGEHDSQYQSSLGTNTKSVTSVHQLKTKVDLSNLRPLATQQVEV